MYDLVTCKNEDDSIKKRLLEWSQVYGDFFRRSRAATSTVLGLIWLDSKAKQIVENVLTTYTENLQQDTTSAI